MAFGIGGGGSSYGQMRNIAEERDKSYTKTLTKAGYGPGGPTAIPGSLTPTALLMSGRGIAGQIKPERSGRGMGSIDSSRSAEPDPNAGFMEAIKGREAGRELPKSDFNPIGIPGRDRLRGQVGGPTAERQTWRPGQSITPDRQALNAQRTKAMTRLQELINSGQSINPTAFGSLWAPSGSGAPRSEGSSSSLSSWAEAVLGATTNIGTSPDDMMESNRPLGPQASRRGDGVFQRFNPNGTSANPWAGVKWS